jgi:23S rRNA (uracil1939-C5)-methyltransferase
MTTMTVKLHDMAYGGDAVGRLDDGRVVFVPLAIPGETVRVQLTEERKGYVRARLLEVLDPSPDRVKPPCRYFGLCGGCRWQHIAYPAQLRFKTEIVRAQLQRIGKQADPPVRPMLGMDEPWAYRNHVQLQVDRHGRVGYHALRSHDVVPVEECWITHELLNDLWGALDVEFEGLRRISLRAGIATGEQMIIFEGEDAEPPELEVDMPISCLYQVSADAADVDADSAPVEDLVVLAGDSHYHERLRDLVFRVSGPSFFQTNTVQAERLVSVVEELLALRPGEALLDAYCGVGTFALLLGARAGRLVGIEGSSWAIADAVANAERLLAETDDDAFPEMELIQGDVAEALVEMAAEDDATFDAVVVDPPRAGCTPETLRALAGTGASRIVYVSCDSATLSRDVLALSGMGYALKAVQPVDMFPQTYHVECVALMSRVDK